MTTKRLFKNLIGIFIFLHNPLVLSAQEQVTDIDGNEYTSVVIGNQCWLAENLRVTRYNNGDPIPYLTENSDWAGTTQGAYTFYNKDSAYIAEFGNLYNWYTVADERGICPEGWHIPTDLEWMELEKYLGMSTSEAGKMTAWRGTTEGKRLKSEAFEGTNETGFSALGTGYRDPEGKFKGKGTDNDYWTTTRYMNKGKEEGVLHGLLNSKSSVVRNFHDPHYGFCVRCIKNKTTQTKQPLSQNIHIYPNPARNTLLVNNLNKEAQLSLYSHSGKLLLSKKISNSRETIDISFLIPGTYHVCIYENQQLENSTFLKF